jgi:catechol 2,3-dioxygenase-like lactoylglutathione lyase family enzyme
MLTVTFAKHSKLTAHPSKQGVIRRFYREVLGVPQARESDAADIFRLGPQFFLSVIYEEDAPTAAAMLRAIWLELATADPVAMKAGILTGGGKEVEYRDKKHFYFQSPCGQVFRLISDAEDMSAWER